MRLPRWCCCCCWCCASSNVPENRFCNIWEAFMKRGILLLQFVASSCYPRPQVPHHLWHNQPTHNHSHITHHASIEQAGPTSAQKKNTISQHPELGRYRWQDNATTGEQPTSAAAYSQHVCLKVKVADGALQRSQGPLGCSAPTGFLPGWCVCVGVLCVPAVLGNGVTCGESRGATSQREGRRSDICCDIL